MYCILVDGKCIYAASDERRFATELLQYANVANCSIEFRKPRVAMDA